MKLSRRQVLCGLGGITVALPLLPSLLDKREAHAAPANAPRRFLALRTGHGGVFGANMYPADATLTDQQQYAGHEIRRGDLSLSTSGQRAMLSPVLSAASDQLTPALVAKMNVLRGLDAPFYLSHNRGGTLGNFGDSDHEMREFIPTCDQVLAWSPNFYGDLSTILLRSAVIGAGGMSWGHTTPEDPNSPVESLHAETSSLSLFNQLYRDPGNQMEPRKPIVDYVLEDYKRLRNGNRRLSKADRQRLDAHVAKLDEIQRRLGVQLSCDGVTPPTQDSGPMQQQPDFLRNPPRHTEYWQLLNDVIVASLSCNTTRIVTLMVGDMWSDGGAVGWFHDTPLEWHQEVAHKSHLSDRQPMIADSHSRFFEHVFVDLAQKLDAVQDPEGGSLLDSSLMFWTQESGSYTHDPIELPIVTAGGAAGWLKTGNYADYRNLNVVAHDGAGENDGGEVTHVGLIYNQFLGTAMQAMGLAPSDYEVEPGGGFGHLYEATETWYAGYQKYPSSVKSARGEPLPFLKA